MIISLCNSNANLLVSFLPSIVYTAKAVKSKYNHLNVVVQSGHLIRRSNEIAEYFLKGPATSSLSRLHPSG